jgi:hypothetical protein
LVSRSVRVLPGDQISTASTRFSGRKRVPTGLVSSTDTSGISAVRHGVLISTPGCVKLGVKYTMTRQGDAFRPAIENGQSAVPMVGTPAGVSGRTRRYHRGA